MTERIEIPEQFELEASLPDGSTNRIDSYCVEIYVGEWTAEHQAAVERLDLVVVDTEQLKYRTVKTVRKPEASESKQAAAVSTN